MSAMPVPQESQRTRAPARRSCFGSSPRASCTCQKPVQAACCVIYHCSVCRTPCCTGTAFACCNDLRDREVRIPFVELRA